MKQKLQNKYKIIILLIILVIGIFIYNFGNSVYNSCFQISENAFVEGKLISINPKVSGFVMQVYVTDNQEVSKGDLLLEIDSNEYKVKLQNMETALRNAKAKLNTYKFSDEGKLSEQNASSPFSKNNFNGYEKLYEDGIISVPNKENNYKNQKIISDETEDENIDPVKLTEQIKKLESEIEQTKLDISCTKVYAPQDGKVTIRDLKEGDYVEIGQNLLSIVPKNVWITAYYPADQINDISAGQLVFIKLKMYPFKKFKGTVDNIQNNTNPAANLQKIPVRIIFTEDYSTYNITPGTSVTTMIKTKQ